MSLKSFALILLSVILTACASSSTPVPSTATVSQPSVATALPTALPTATSVPSTPTSEPLPTATIQAVFIDAIYYREVTPHEYEYFHFYADGQVTTVRASLMPPGDVYETYQQNRQWLELGRSQENITGRYVILDGQIQFSDFPPELPLMFLAVSGTYEGEKVVLVLGDGTTAEYVLYDGEP